VPGSRAQLETSGSARPEFLDQVHELLAELWRLRPEIAALDRMMFTTAVLEIGNNILRHGSARTIALALEGDASRLQAEFTDDGRVAEVDLSSAALPEDLAESGRGLVMVQLAVDEVAHEYVDGRNHWHLLRRHQGSLS